MCTCSGGYYLCDTCPFDHGTTQACSDATATCGISGFEKDCYCWCDGSLWHCRDELMDTVGATSHCPYEVPLDAGVVDI